MIVRLKPEVERFAQQRARELGYNSVDDYIGALLEQEKQQQPKDTGAGRGKEAVDKLRGSARGGLRADEIMDITRSERLTISSWTATS